MTTSGTGVALRAAGPSATDVVDISCGSCEACVAGARLWCDDPRQEGRVLVSTRVGSAAASVSALLLADAVRSAELGGDEVVLVLGGGEARAAAALVRRIHPGEVLVASDAKDAALREQLDALRPSGRADVVAAAADDRTAVRAVARGGDVCLAGEAAPASSVTELVQREVRLVGPRDVAGLVAAVGRMTAESALSQI
jgi:threonine dehydrogenase-like Zn-dependent dehydrogenase